MSFRINSSVFLGVAERTDYCKCFGWGLPGCCQEDPRGTRGTGPPVLVEVCLSPCRWFFILTKSVLQCLAENRRETLSLYIYIYDCICICISTLHTCSMCINLYNIIQIEILGRFEQVTFLPRSASIKHDTNSGIMHNVAHYPASALCDPCNILLAESPWRHPRNFPRSSGLRALSLSCAKSYTETLLTVWIATENIIFIFLPWLSNPQPSSNSFECYVSRNPFWTKSLFRIPTIAMHEYVATILPWEASWCSAR